MTKTVQEIKANQIRTAHDMRAITKELKEIYKGTLANNEDWSVVSQTDEIVLDLTSKLNRLSNQAEELAILLNKTTK